MVMVHLGRSLQEKATDTEEGTSDKDFFLKRSKRTADSLRRGRSSKYR
jgi:hypothetical protein